MAVKLEDASDILDFELKSRRTGSLRGAGEIAIAGTPTAIYDLDGTLLLWRFSLSSGGGCGHADVGALEELAGPLLAVAPRSPWNPASILVCARDRATSAGVTTGKSRLVAYSYPKLGVQFLEGDQETLLLDAATMEPVPPIDEQEPFFRRYSLRESLTNEQKQENRNTWSLRETYRRTLVTPPVSPAEGVECDRHFAMAMAPSTFAGPTLTQKHQVNPKWCVAACAQMILSYHTINSTQNDLAQSLGLVDKWGRARPLPDEPAAVARVAAELASRSQATGTCPPAGITSQSAQLPPFTSFQQLLHQGPTIGFIPGHARVVTGYSSQTNNGVVTAKELRVYDPYDPANSPPEWVSADVPVEKYLCTGNCPVHA